MIEVRQAVAGRDSLGESPVWDERTASLWWVDIEGALLQRFVPATGAVTRWTMPERIAVFAFRETGGVLVALASSFAFFDPQTGALDRILAPEPDRPGNRLNDGRCDRRGRFWAGTMDDNCREPTGALYRLDPDLTCRRVLDGIGISNSLCWSPDEKTLYLADTLDRTIYAFAHDGQSGMIDARQVFVTTRPPAGAPDGSAVDEQGFLWNAEFDGSRLVRYAPDGHIDAIVPLPVSRPTSCAFGGDDLRTLFVTTAIWDLSEAEQARQPLAGNLLSLEPNVRGLPASRFAG